MLTAIRYVGRNSAQLDLGVFTARATRRGIDIINLTPLAQLILCCTIDWADGCQVMHTGLAQVSRQSWSAVSSSYQSLFCGPISVIKLSRRVKMYYLLLGSLGEVRDL